MKTVSIHQPNYLPYAGFFHKIAASDVFVLLDNVQYEKNSFTNRCKINTPGNPSWLTVDVLSKGKHAQAISEVLINPRVRFREKHLKTITQTYSKTPYFNEFFRDLERVYLREDWRSLAALNTALIKNICNLLGIQTPIVKASELGVKGKSTDLLISICKNLEATRYLSGQGAKKYMNEASFTENNIELAYANYYEKPYPQTSKTFQPYLSIIDMLFNIGTSGTLEMLKASKQEETSC